jgi:hypothetical protein
MSGGLPGHRDVRGDVLAASRLSFPVFLTGIDAVPPRKKLGRSANGCKVSGHNSLGLIKSTPLNSNKLAQYNTGWKIICLNNHFNKI